MVAMGMDALTPAGFAASHDVSHETLGRLEAYVELLLRWNPRINLVSASTLTDPWRRHIQDSAQIWPDLAPSGRLADLGTGAGLPGLILAILGRADVVLVEADQRKCAFLREAARVTDTAIQIRQGRMEAVEPVDATIVTARACAPLERLLGYAERHLVSGGTAIFLKGRSVDQELADAAREWRFQASKRPSATDPEACVLRLENIARA